MFEIGHDHIEYFKKARSVAASAGASLTGSPARGRFSHRGIRGKYRADGELVIVDLDKPIGVPWGPLERALVRFFERNPQH